jgi:hypothetical protein
MEDAADPPDGSAPFRTSLGRRPGRFEQRYLKWG